ncbi:MAG TPA: hypothetical protein VK934_05235 [Fimbriimonas sp.]|nr:hypothetical protein [Fimbriimonas sp.]
MSAITATLLALTLTTPSSGDLSDVGAESLRFTANAGQWHRDARFLARTPGMDLWVTNQGVTYDFYRREGRPLLKSSRVLEPALDRSHRMGHVVQVGFDGALPTSRARANGRLRGVSHFLKGGVSARFVPSYAKAEVRGLYTGVDMRLYADTQTGGPRFDIVLAPGADLAQVKMRYQGAQRLRVDRQGRVAFDTALGTVVERGLYAYEVGADGSRNEVKVKPVVQSGVVTYRAAQYDPAKTLVIDPLVSSTFLGYSDSDELADMLLTSAGEQIVAGLSASVDYPVTPGAYDDWGQSYDGVVTKMNADSSAIIWSTFIGGAGADVVHSIVMDSTQRLVISGYTSSQDFPTTATAYDQVGKGGPLNSEFDAFVSKLSDDGSTLVFSTYFASSGVDTSLGLALDSLDRIYISGSSTGADLPTKAAYQGRYGGGDSDGYAASFSANGQTLRFCTYLGGNDGDVFGDLALDSQGRIAVVGASSSLNYPTRYAFQRLNAGSRDGVLSLLDPLGKVLLFSTFYGGADGSEELVAVGFDSTSRIVAAGTSNSTAIDADHFFGTLSGPNAIVLAVAPNWTRSFASVLGGIQTYFGFSIGADDRITFSGQDQGSDITATNGAFQYVSAGEEDGILVRINKTGSVISYLSRFGGRLGEYAYDGVYGPTGVWHMVGFSNSRDLPTSSAAFDKSPGGSDEGFLAQLSLSAGKVMIDPVSFTNGDASTNVTLRIPVAVAGSTTINLTGGGGIVQVPSTATIIGGNTSVTISVPLNYVAGDVGKLVRITAKLGTATAQRVVEVPAP